MHSILLIDDKSDNLTVLSQLFKEQYKVFACKSGSEGLKLAASTLPDLILLDILMPEMDGFEVLKQLKENSSTQRIPVIFITGLRSPKDEEKGLCLGAMDYIHKPFHHGIVKARVNNALASVRQTQLLEELAQLDSLTELPNRRKWQLDSELTWQQAIDSGYQLGLGIIDIDCFKLYNDHYGHAAGDLVLKTVACFFRSKLALLGIELYRYGGEEFVFIMHSHHMAQFKQEISLLSQALAEQRLDHKASKVADVITASIGVALVTPKPFDKLSHVFEQADLLMYTAKKNGGNQVLIDIKE